MLAQSQRIIGQILAPQASTSVVFRPLSSTSMTIEQIINPTGVYTGPERRAQGMLVAEIVPSPGFSAPASREDT